VVRPSVAGPPIIAQELSRILVEEGHRESLPTAHNSFYDGLAESVMDDKNLPESGELAAIPHQTPVPIPSGPGHFLSKLANRSGSASWSSSLLRFAIRTMANVPVRGTRSGTQMIFSDMGVHPTSWGYSAYDDIIAKLIARGIPREHIAAVGDADSDAKKQALFEKVRSGSVRVLIPAPERVPQLRSWLL
jgi:hypothetical protein